MKVNKAKEILESVGYIVESFEDELRNAFITQCGEMVIGNEPIWRRYYNRIMKNPDMVQYISDAKNDGLDADEIVEYLLDWDEQLNESKKQKIKLIFGIRKRTPGAKCKPAFATFEEANEYMDKFTYPQDFEIVNLLQHPELLENSGYFVEAKMSLKDKINNAKQFNKNKYTKDENLLIKIAEDNDYKLIGKDIDEDGSNRFIFEKKYKGETISFNASLYYEKNDCQINYDFDYESGNDYFDETWGDNLKTYEDEAIREIDEKIEESEWDEEELDEDFTQGVGAPLGADQGIPHSMDCCAVPMMRLGEPAPRRSLPALWP